ncbi:uncharacterized protein LOC129589261 isoform X2 [Paramacrobiotus metropolitanus]|uniref:uncharacterized protein LOC129589261 isoform X2 n=1 Tax=Paramacrobiotus metropolitanus TaxID=2943436 RepID=UPI0024461A48|nr:uncharacterized protein LOC129589261 isoform X2 [Paramacrobiotus metropolitanus]
MTCLVHVRLQKSHHAEVQGRILWKDVAVVQHHDHSMGQAMRYYRVWIYISVTVTVIPAVVFGVAIAWIFNEDYFALLPFEPYDWTFLYLYITVTFQIFFAPTLGCLGATKLNARLLWAYWGSLVILSIGDAITGTVWIMKSIQVNKQLQQHLYTLVTQYYGIDPAITNLWNRVQIAEQCCGIEQASDFSKSIWYKNLISAGLSAISLQRRKSDHVPVHLDAINTNIITMLPASCCSTFFPADSHPATNCTITALSDAVLHKQGCYLALHTWMHRMGDILFVLGFSIMAFVRVAMVFCLYNEIKHFVRKIQMRRAGNATNEMPHSSLSAEPDLANFHHNSGVLTGPAGSTKKPCLDLLSTGTGALDANAERPRWSFARRWRALRNRIRRKRPVQTTSLTPQHPASRSNSTIKLKSINEETATML